MPLPEFTPEEQYLINFVKLSKDNAANPYMWCYVLTGIVFGAFAAYYDSIPMMASAFAVVCGFRIFEELHGAKWTPTWGSIIEKYENAATETDTAGNA